MMTAMRYVGDCFVQVRPPCNYFVSQHLRALCLSISPSAFLKADPFVTAQPGSRATNLSTCQGQESRGSYAYCQQGKSKSIIRLEVVRKMTVVTQATSAEMPKVSRESPTTLAEAFVPYLQARGARVPSRRSDRWRTATGVAPGAAATFDRGRF